MKNNWFNSHELLWNMVQFHRAGNVASLFICLCCCVSLHRGRVGNSSVYTKKVWVCFCRKFILATLKIQYFYRMILINYRKGIHPDHLGCAWKSPRIMFCHSLLYSFSVREQKKLHALHRILKSTQEFTAHIINDQLDHPFQSKEENGNKTR